MVPPTRESSTGTRVNATSNDAITLFGRVDWDLSDAHRLTLRHNFSTFSNDNEWNGNFDFEYGFSRAEKLEDRSHSFVGELQSVLGDRTFNVLRFQFADETRPRQGKDLRPTLTVNLSNGQRIPDDLYPAARKKLWLVNQAVECMEASEPRIDERLMAERYAQVSVAHA